MLHHGKMYMSILVNKYVDMFIIELFLIFQDVMHFKMFSTFVIFFEICPPYIVLCVHYPLDYTCIHEIIFSITRSIFLDM